MSTLSVVTTVDLPITKEFYLKELICSVLDIADEIVIVDGNPNGHTSYSETMQIIDEIADELGGSIVRPEINLYFNPWEPRMRRNMMMLQKSVGISHAKSDYILYLDADEVIHEKDHNKIKKAMELGHDAYTFKVRHFYKDFNHYKVNSEGDHWYERRPYLFKNNLGMFDGYRYIEDEGKCRYTSDMTTWDYEPVMGFAKHTSIEIYHYSFVREEKAMLSKYNAIERRHHPDWQDVDKWEWDMSNTKKFNGTHPLPIEAVR